VRVIERGFIVSQNYLYCLPWLSIEETINIEDFIIMPFKEFDKQDHLHKKDIKKYLYMYRDYYNNPVKNPTLIFNKKVGLGEISPDRLEDLNYILKLLHFTNLYSISRVPNTHSYKSSEYFDLLRLNIEDRDKCLAVDGGNMHHLDFEEHFYHQPRGIIVNNSNSAFNFNYDSKDLEALLNIPNKEKEKLIRCLDLFFYINIHHRHILYDYKIVMMASIFEILFEAEKARAKSVEIQKHLDSITSDWDLLYIKTPENIKKIEDWSKPVEFMYKFYNLRNDIVHGKKLTKDDFLYTNKSEYDWENLPYLEVAKNLFKEIVRDKYIKKKKNWLNSLERSDFLRRCEWEKPASQMKTSIKIWEDIDE